MISNKLKKFHHKLFWLLILLLPTQLGYHFWPEWATVFGIRVDYLSPTVYLTDLVVAMVLITWFTAERKNGKTEKLKNPYCFLFFSLLVFLFFSSVFVAQNQGAALYKLVKLVEFVLLGFYVSRNQSLITSHQSLFTIPLLYSSILAWAQFLSGHTLGGIFWWLGERTFDVATPGIALVTINGQDFLRPYATFPHPNVLAGFLLVILVMLNSFQHLSRMTWIVCGMAIATIIATFSHSAWIAGAAALFIGVIPALRERLVLISKSLLIILIAGSFLIVWVGQNLKDFPQDVEQRLELSSVALRLTGDFPLTGVGLNNFVIRLPEYGISPGTTWFLQPVHNIFLLVLAETGIIGFVFLLWFLFQFLKKLAIGHWPLAIPFLVILITGTADHYWLTLQQGQLLAAIVFGMALSKTGEN